MANAINKLICENVLNYTYDPLNGYDAWRDPNGNYYTSQPNQPNTFSPSTNLEDAWRIVDSIAKSHSVVIENMDYGNIQWRCIINRRDYPFGAYHESENFTHSICLCLLKVFQVSESLVESAKIEDNFY